MPYVTDIQLILTLNENTNLNATITDNGDQALYANQICLDRCVHSANPDAVSFPAKVL